MQTLYADHARLKEHVANMEGGLEAKINEGGESRKFLPVALSVGCFITLSSPSYSRVSAYLLVGYICCICCQLWHVDASLQTRIERCSTIQSSASPCMIVHAYILTSKTSSPHNRPIPLTTHHFIITHIIEANQSQRTHVKTNVGRLLTHFS